MFLISYGALSAFAISRLAGAVEARIFDQMRNLGRLLSRGSLHPGLRDSVREISGGELVVLHGNAVNSDLSTLSPGLVQGALEGITFLPDRPVPVRLSDGTAYLAWRSEMQAPPEMPTAVLLLYPERVLAEERKAAIGPLVALSVAGLLLVGAVSFVVARGIARPIEELADRAQSTVSPEANLPVPAGAAEVGRLGAAINRMLAQLREAQARLLDAEKVRAVREVAAGAAHEIKNPLQAIQMLVQMQKGMDPADREAILREIRRIELAGHDLLTLDDRVPIKRQRIDPARVVTETLDILRETLRHRRVNVRQVLAPTGPIEGDPDRLQRAVLNLVLNGAQAMPGGGELLVRLEGQNAGIRFSVTDAGPGVPEQIRERLFEPFVTAKADGVGLGLFVTRRIVEAHGGKIGFESRPGATTFYFDLPASPAGGK